MRKTAISFGLVHIPVKYENAIQENNISFNQLHKETKERVRYKKYCPESGIEDVKNTDIVKGYEYEKDKYVIMTDDDLEKIKTEKDKMIHIESFTQIQNIDPIFYEKSYYLVPDGSEKAFSLFQQALEEEKKVAIAKTVLGTKETLVILRSGNGSLLMETMYYMDEIKRMPKQSMDIRLNQTELEMAKTLIQSMTKEFIPENYHDEYLDRLKAAITEKINGQEVTKAYSVEESNVINLMEALQASIQQMEKVNQSSGEGKEKEMVTV